MEIPDLFSSSDVSSSRLLQGLVTFTRAGGDLCTQSCDHTLTHAAGKFPDLQKQLDFFGKAFCHKTAREQGIIIPHSGEVTRPNPH